MRVRCPACAAPYFLPPVPPPNGPRCPNCEAPAPSDTGPPPRRFHAPAEPEGRSRVVTVAALLHLFMATGGLCATVGSVSVAGDLGPDLRSLVGLAVTGGIAFIWAFVGVGLLMRWVGAWYVSLVLNAFTFLLGLLTAARNPCGAVYLCVLCCAIAPVLILRHAEFR